MLVAAPSTLQTATVSSASILRTFAGTIKLQHSQHHDKDANVLSQVALGLHVSTNSSQEGADGPQQY